MKHSVVFDSGDPKLPNLPETDEVNWSDYSNYNFSGGEESDSSEGSSYDYEEDGSSTELNLEDLQRNRKKGKRRGSNFFLPTISTNKSSSLQGHNSNSTTSQTLNKTDSHKLSKQKHRHNHKNKKGKGKSSKKFVSYFEDSFNNLSDSKNDKSTNNNVSESRPPLAGGSQSAHTILQPTEAHRKAAGSTPKLNKNPTPYTGEDVPRHTPISRTTSSASFPNRATNTIHNRKRKTRKYFESKTSSSEARKRADWEPGIDISTTKVALSSPGSAITVTDYSDTRYRVEHFEVFSEMAPLLDDYDDISLTKSRDFIGDYINKVNSSKQEFNAALNNVPTWSKVRWINVNGLSWEAITLIANRYHLHRLAIEDMIDIPQRTKVDRYPHHIFAVFPLLKLIKIDNDNDETQMGWKDFLHSFFSNLEEADEPTEDWFDQETYDSYDGSAHIRKSPTSTNDDSHSTRSITSSTKKSSSATKKRQSLTSQIANIPMNRLSDLFFTSRTHKNRKLHFIESHRPLNYRGLTVGVEQTSMFITDSNTVISFFEHSAHEVEQSILSRLSSERTLLRDSCDPSILFQSILDSVVDLVYPIVTAYNRRLSEFEYDILVNPTMSHTKELHLMIGELARLKSSIMPISAMVNQLKDQARSHSSGGSSSELSAKEKLSVPLISEATEIYLSDVYDHTISFSDDIDAMRNNIENLTNLIFNTISVNTNYSMQSLSVITVIFLPLSFWTGYYGMNFTKFGDLGEDVSYYWKIAVPFSAGLMLLIMWSSLFDTISKYQKMARRWIGEVNDRLKQRRETKKAKKRRSMRNKFIEAFSSSNNVSEQTLKKAKNESSDHKEEDKPQTDNNDTPTTSSSGNSQLHKTQGSGSSLHKVFSKKSESNLNDV